MSDTGREPTSGRVVAVSGAGTGIGQAIAVKCAGLGWRVAVGGRRVERLEETAELVGGGGGTCLTHELDVTDPDSVDRFFGAAESELGTVTAVVNNAATARYGPLEEFEPSEIQIEIATKLIGSLYMARRGIQAMRRAGTGGDLLFISSSAGATPWPLHLPYAAANAGVEHAARTLRLELEGCGIRVSILRCGETGGTEFGLRESQTGRIGPATEHWFRRGLLRHGGLMAPEDVAEAVVAAVTLPSGYQYETLSVVPTAPAGELPATFDDFGAAVVARLTADQEPPPEAP